MSKRSKRPLQLTLDFEARPYAYTYVELGKLWQQSFGDVEARLLATAAADDHRRIFGVDHTFGHTFWTGNWSSLE